MPKFKPDFDAGAGLYNAGIGLPPPKPERTIKPRSAREWYHVATITGVAAVLATIIVASQWHMPVGQAFQTVVVGSILFWITANRSLRKRTRTWFVGRRQRRQVWEYVNRENIEARRLAGLRPTVRRERRGLHPATYIFLLIVAIWIGLG
jgi:hypothetical protein